MAPPCINEVKGNGEGEERRAECVGTGDGTQGQIKEEVKEKGNKRLRRRRQGDIMRNERRREDGIQVESSDGVMNSPRWKSVSGGWNLKGGGGRESY